MNDRYIPREHQPHLSDEELVDRSIERAAASEQTIDAATARMIASMLHSGQFSALYAFASSGALLDGLRDELDRERRLAVEHDAPGIAVWVEQLQAYISSRDSSEPTDGWSDLWLEQPDYEDVGLDADDCCTECGEHFSEPHDPTCSRSHEDYPEEDDGFQSARTEADPRAQLEAEIQAKLGHISTGNLVRRMERAQDFAYDNEQVELSRRLREQGKTWRWSDSFTNPKVIIYEVGDGE